MKAQSRSRGSIVACIVALSLTATMAQAPRLLKTWSFKLPHGSLEIELQSLQNGGLAMYIGPDQQGLEAPVREQIESLKKVLAEMQKLGFNPVKLDYIGTRTFGRDVSEKLAYACADSQEWRISVQQNHWQEKGELVAFLLNKSGAYEPYNDAFTEYGIRVRVAEAEIMGLAPLPGLRSRYSRDYANPKMPVPYVYVGMRFSPIRGVSEK